MRIEFQDVTKSYMDGNKRKDVLIDVNLKIKDNTLNLITGSTGSGKSTLINLASLMLKPSSGKIIINNRDTTNLTDEDRSLLRREEIGIIYQRDNLFPFLNLVENVSIPLLSKDLETPVKLLEKMGFNDTSKYPQELSLLNQQKVALARALINQPSLLLMDEPTGELNSIETEEYMDIINEFKNKCTILTVSNKYDLKEYFDYIFLLHDGILKRD